MHDNKNDGEDKVADGDKRVESPPRDTPGLLPRHFEGSLTTSPFLRRRDFNWVSVILRRRRSALSCHEPPPRRASQRVNDKRRNGDGSKRVHALAGL
jgi:hypothetical protein